MSRRAASGDAPTRGRGSRAGTTKTAAATARAAFACRRARMDSGEGWRAKCPRVVVTDLSVSARQRRSIHAPVHQSDAAPHRRREAGRETAHRSPGWRAASHTTNTPASGARFGRMQIAASIGEAGQRGADGHDEHQRERPGRGHRHVAHRVHQLIQEHRARRDKRAPHSAMPGASNSRRPSTIRQPDRQRAAQRHDEKRAAVTGDAPGTAPSAAAVRAHTAARSRRVAAGTDDIRAATRSRPRPATASRGRCPADDRQRPVRQRPAWLT